MFHSANCWKKRPVRAKQCDRCGRHNGCTGKRGACPAWGKECGICRGKNHYKVVCWKAAQIQAGGGAQPRFQKRGKGKSPGKNGKAKAKHAHSVAFKMVPSAKGTFPDQKKELQHQNRSLQNQVYL